MHSIQSLRLLYIQSAGPSQESLTSLTEPTGRFLSNEATKRGSSDRTYWVHSNTYWKLQAHIIRSATLREISRKALDLMPQLLLSGQDLVLWPLKEGGLVDIFGRKQEEPLGFGDKGFGFQLAYHALHPKRISIHEDQWKIGAAGRPVSLVRSG